MEYLNSILSQLNQKVLLEEEAIQTLSNRLQHATLSSDRRSAVLGLKSFSRQYRESVVEHGLRALLQTLSKDLENPALVKAVLEALLILFLRGEGDEDQTRGWISNQSRVQNGKYPSPLLVDDINVDQFSMWIADEFTLSDDHIKLLVDILQENEDFHIRLYALQLLEALVSTRLTRSRECLMNIPTAVSTIVSLLNDENDPIRNETILLLMGLVNNNFNIQKLVAFENTFDRLFEIIAEEGGIRGSILVQDCLTLLTNLLLYNASNQKFFLETDCVPKLAKLLAEPVEEAYEEDMLDDEGNPISVPPIVWTEQRLQNMKIALEICRAFVNEDNQQILQNQNKLFQSGIFFSVLRLAFSPITENAIRTTSLLVTGDIVAGNTELQLQFSQIDVPYIDPSLPKQVQKFEHPAPVPLALLNWILLVNSVHTFDIRLASMYCLHAFIKNNKESKFAFLIDQIKASKNPDYFDELADELTIANGTDLNGQHNGANGNVDDNTTKTPVANIFSTLMDFDFEIKLNPYRLWFAATTLVYLFEDSPENRQLARDVKVGNAEEGEEVMTAIQAIAGILTTTLDNPDPRIAIGYLLLLTIWLYEDFEAVNDFISDPSIVKSILAFLSKNSTDSSDLVHGMSAILIGIAYEFSTKDSPIPRVELHSLITKALGVDNYSLKVKQFRESEFFKNFDSSLTTEFTMDSTGLPAVYFISNYVDLIKDNFFRIRRALHHDPLVEPQARISYEAFEDLESKHAELTRTLENLKMNSSQTEVDLKSQISQVQDKLLLTTKAFEETTQELEELKISKVEFNAQIETVSKELKEMEVEKKKFEATAEKHSNDLQKISKQNSCNEGSLQQIKHKLSEVEGEKQKAEDGINKMSRELFQLTKQKTETESKVNQLEKELSKAKTQSERSARDHDAELLGLRKVNDGLQAKIQTLELHLKAISDDRDKCLREMKEVQAKLTDIEQINEHLMEKLRAAATVVLDLRKTISEQTQHIGDLTAADLKMKSDLEKLPLLKDEITSLRKANQDHELKLKEILDSTGTEKGALVDELLTLKALKCELESKLKGVQEELGNLKTEIKKERTKFDDSVKSYEAKLSAQEKSNSELTLAWSELEECYSEQTKKLEQTLEELSQLKTAHNEHKLFVQKQLEEKDLAFKTSLDEFATLNEKFISLQEEHDIHVSELKLEHDRVFSERELLATNHKSLNNQHDELEKSYVLLKADLESVSSAKEELLSNHKNLNNEHDELQKCHKDLKREHESITSEKDLLLQNHKGFNSQYEELQKSFEKLKSEHGSIASEKELQLRNYENLDNEHNDLQKSHKQLNEETEQLNLKYKSSLEAIALKEIEIKKLSTELQAAECNLNKKDDALAVCQKSLSYLEVQIAAVSDKAKSSLESFEKEKAELESARTTLGSRLHEVQSSKDQLTKQLQDLQTSHEKELQLHSETISRNGTLFASAKEALLSEIAILNQELQTKVDEFSKSKESLRAKIEELSKSKENLLLQVTEISTSKGALETKVEELSKTKVDLSLLVEEISKSNEELTSQVDQLSKSKDEAESKTKELSKAKDDLTLKAEDLTKSTADLQLEVKELSKSKQELQSKIVEISKSNNTLQSEVELLSKSEVELKSKITSLDSSAKEEKSALNGALDSIKRELEAKIKDKKDIEVDLIKHIAQKETLDKDLIARSTINDALTKELQDREIELEMKSKAVLNTERIVLNVTSELNELKKELLKSKNDKNVLQLTLETTQISLHKVKQTLEKTKQEFEAGEKKITELSQNLEVKSNDYLQVTKDFGIFKTQSESRISKLEELKSEKQGTITSLEADLKQKAKEVEQERAMLTQSSESVMKEYTQKISTLESAVSSLKECHRVELQDTRSKLKQEIEKLTTALLTAKTEQEELTSNFNLQKESLEEVKKNLEVVIEKFEVEAKDSRKELDTFKLVLATSSKEVAILREELKTKSAALEAVSEVTETKSREIQDLLEETSSLRSRYGSEIEELTKKLDAGVASLALLQGEKVEVQSKLEIASKARDELEVELQGQIEKLKKEIEELKSSTSELRALLATEKENSTTAASALQSLKTKLEAEMKLKDAEFSELKRKEEKTKEQIQAFEMSGDGAKKELQKVNGILSALEAELANSKYELDSLSEEKKANKKSIYDLEAKLLASTEKEQALYNRGKESEEKQATISGELLSLRKLHDEAKKESEKLFKDHESTKKELTEKLSFLDNLKTGQSNLNEELKAKQAMLEDTKLAHQKASEVLLKKLTLLEESCSTRMKLEAELKEKLALLENFKESQKQLSDELKEKIELLEGCKESEKKLAEGLKAKLNLLDDSKESYKTLSEELEEKMALFEECKVSHKKDTDELKEKLALLTEDREFNQKKNEELKMGLFEDFNTVQERTSVELKEKLALLEVSKVAHEKLIEEFQEQAELLKQTELSTKKLEDDLKKSQSEITASNKELDQLKTDKESLELQLHVLLSKRDMEAEVERKGLAVEKEHKEEIERLQKELKAKEKVQADFEDLMLLLEDQEKKNQKYKKILRSLNQEISSDEESDEDDDEGDDEED